MDGLHYPGRVRLRRTPIRSIQGSSGNAASGQPFHLRNHAVAQAFPNYKFSLSPPHHTYPREIPGKSGKSSGLIQL